MVTREKERIKIKVNGIGGVFIYANDPKILAECYAAHLGIEFQHNDLAFPPSISQMRQRQKRGYPCRAKRRNHVAIC